MNADVHTSSLLATKLYIPSPHANVVSRPHLLARLDDGLRRSTFDEMLKMGQAMAQMRENAIADIGLGCTVKLEV